MKAIKGLFLIGSVALLSACNSNNMDYDASGVFETTEVFVSAQATGQLMQFNLEEGQVLNTKTPIGYIDTTQLYLQKMQLLANKGVINSRQTDIPRQIAATKQEIETQQKERVRYQNLVKLNAATQKQVDDINAKIQLLEKQEAAQIETLQNSNKGVSSQSSELAVQVAQIDNQIHKSIITSPINGTVLTKYAEQGELASPGKELFKVADVSVMFLRAYITASQLTQVKIGQKVKVYADFGEKDKKEYSGTISWISNKSEFTPKTIQTRDERANLVYAVKIEVKNNGLLKEGMYGEVKL